MLTSLKIFNAAERSILFCPDLGFYFKYDEEKILFRLLTKKVLLLPKNTPNYMIYLETGLNSLFADTLKLHFIYINRAHSIF